MAGGYDPDALYGLDGELGYVPDGDCVPPPHAAIASENERKTARAGAFIAQGDGRWSLPMQRVPN
jgi:hypothetical protein